VGVLRAHLVGKARGLRGTIVRLRKGRGGNCCAGDNVFTKTSRAKYSGPVEKQGKIQNPGRKPPGGSCSRGDQTRQTTYLKTMEEERIKKNLCRGPLRGEKKGEKKRKYGIHSGTGGEKCAHRRNGAGAGTWQPTAVFVLKLRENKQKKKKKTRTIPRLKGIRK